MRAKSIQHAEYEILTHLLGEIDLQDLRDEMCDDAHSTKRFDVAAKNICKMLAEKQWCESRTYPRTTPSESRRVFE